MASEPDDEKNTWLRCVGATEAIFSDKILNQIIAEKLISEKHTYETPCILKLDITNGNKKFLNWIEETIV